MLFRSGCIHFLKQAIGLRSIDLFPGQGTVGEFKCPGPFLGRDKGKLLDKGGIVITFFADLAKDASNGAGGNKSLLLRHPAVDEATVHVFAEPLVRLARCPSSLDAKTSDVRQARFKLCEDTRRRGTPPKTTLLGRPVSSRLRFDGP